LGFSCVSVFSFAFSFLFRRTPDENENLWYPFSCLVPPFPLLSSFPLSDNFSGFCVDPLSKKIVFFFTLFFPFFFLLHSAKPSRPSFSLLSPLHACPINLGLSFVLVFFFDPPLFGGFSFLFFFLSTRSKLQLVVSFFAHYSPPACCCPFFVIGQLFGIFEFIEFFLIEFFSHLFFFHACFSLTLFCVVFPPVLP